MPQYFDLTFHPLVLLVRLGCAILLGALLTWRPFCRRPVRTEVKQALFLMTVAAAMVVTVIGDSLARAFGVVGLGSFVRFRSSLKDPREVVLFFVAIGTGMACGLGTVVTAGIGVGVLWTLMSLLDYLSRNEPPPAPKPKTSVPEPKPPAA